MENVSVEELKSLVGNASVEVFNSICDYINNNYEMDKTWKNAGKWGLEYKFRKGGKTFCTFYFKENSLKFMIIFGKDERAKIELNRNEYSKELIKLYDDTTTFHDGKWLMLELNNLLLLEDIKKMLLIKRKPNKK